MGRKKELDQIHHVLATQRGARGVLAVGPAGIGKSRLLDEAQAAAPQRRVVSLHPRAQISVTASRGGPPSVSSLTQLRSELARYSAMPVSDSSLLIVDDVDHLSAEVIPLLFHALRNPGIKLLVSATSNGGALPSAVRALLSDTSFKRLDLCPLAMTDVRELTNSLLNGGIEHTGAARLTYMCDGNPRLLLEIVRTAVEQRALRLVDDCWHFDPAQFTVPPSLLEMTAPELEKLDESDRLVLDLVALADEPSLDSIEKFCDVGRLERLEHRDLIRAVHVDGRARVRIVHPLVRYALSHGLPALRQRRLLRDWLSAHGGLQALLPHADCGRLAEWHLDALEVPPRELLDRAVKQSFRAQSLPRAVRLTGAGWQHYPAEDTASLHAQALTAVADFAGLASFAADVRRCEPAYTRAMQKSEAHALLLQARYEELDESLPALPVTEQDYYRMTTHYFRGDFVRAYAEAEGLRRNGPQHQALEAGLIMMGSLCHMGLPEQALALYQRLGEELEQSSDHSYRFHADSLEELHATALHYCGRLDDAERIYRREYIEASERHHVRIEAQRGLALAQLLHDRGEIEAALKCADFGPSYRVGWRQWQIKAGIYVALASSSLPHTLRPADPLPETLSLDDAGHCAVLLAVVKARRYHEQGETEAATHILHEMVAAAVRRKAHADAVVGMHECARLSLPLPAVDHHGLRLEGGFLQARVDYALAQSAGDAKRLGRVARLFADMGAFLFAAEAYAEQARLHQRCGASKAANAATVQARELLRRCGPVQTPPLHFLGESVLLTDREQQIARLAARGLQDKEIAGRLCLSVRTVSNTLYRVYRKVGAANRRELQALMNRGGHPI
ncbi:LuxR C-terminal-related transcriptional regulator [Streptomyces sp. NPDC048514]|uniref:helix-turn-helix transcriptional regulator n=1 Tax=Streptomyces sp. NPDC048514 TaxID=3365564 RepID=UPI0037227F8C